MLKAYPENPQREIAPRLDDIFKPQLYPFFTRLSSLFSLSAILKLSFYDSARAEIAKDLVGLRVKEVIPVLRSSKLTNKLYSK